MAATAIKTEKGNLVFMTVQKEAGIDIDVYAASEEFTPITSTSRGEDTRDEETYHRELRKEASAHGQYVPGYSTNPEWNPDYKAEEEAQDGV